MQHTWSTNLSDLPPLLQKAALPANGRRAALARNTQETDEVEASHRAGSTTYPDGRRGDGLVVVEDHVLEEELRCVDPRI